MNDWEYCKQTLPRVSRTFALNISVLTGGVHRSVLAAYLFCRIVDTVEDAEKLDSQNKIDLLLEFCRIMQNECYRKDNLPAWLERCRAVDGSENDLELLRQTFRVFNVFDSLSESHRNQIIPSVCRMAQGMAYFQKRFSGEGLTLLEDEYELEEYCYFVAGCVGEMLCNLFCVELPGLSNESRKIMEGNAVSFGLGLQITNIAKDFLIDRRRGWSYIPRSVITRSGLSVEEFSSGESLEKCLEVVKCLLNKTVGHLNDALKFTLALPQTSIRLRLFCVWPLWMALETVAILNDNPDLLASEDPVKISRNTVKKILRNTPWIAWSNNLLTRSFNKIQKRCNFSNPPRFNFTELRERLDKIPLDTQALSTS